MAKPSPNGEARSRFDSVQICRHVNASTDDKTAQIRKTANTDLPKASIGIAAPAKNAKYGKIFRFKSATAQILCARRVPTPDQTNQDVRYHFRQSPLSYSR